ncbi:hypothetical protein GE21DRAFT_3448 [Neurospora crassa]|uniref:Vacuolar morphogenesis protein AvaB n=1 Tax=Neurospora crassa (strain ATCC 24698 / 74-OR23-1A / CBS 708.71 / DSM 1257 / FGSC 987) TaxID=367110 RepID=F5HBK9_NEUCR|nr:vacuolar morphogenesis protein AvaB [Neurospora crassa OR74A]EAA27006.3 vacuolar morphogenesis protein AvaB [Neurospora crassa OR74A]KHE87203.1 hypothetical protein GE21DRAFT_3448 [Neurospora crassa]|eukprot:XP_956242.3 vacuolar morphogenesis protein AvaB [Neurospora crassa OR74A]
MLSAFTARPIIELKQRDKSKIESILAYGDRVLVGLNTGSLRIYRVNELPPAPPPPPPPPPPSQSANGTSSQQLSEATTESTTQDPNGPLTTTQEYQAAAPGFYNAQAAPRGPKPTDLLREVEKFSTRAIEQLAIIKEANTIISLSNYNGVALHDLQTFEPIEFPTARTKSASTFAVTSNIVKDPDTGIPEIISRLAVAVKRRLLLWSWHESELSPDVTEIVLSEAIRSLTWANANKVVCGMNGGYQIVDITTGQMEDIVGPGAIGAAGGQSRFGATASMGYMGLGNFTPKPLSAKLAEGQLLLAKDINTLFINDAGKALEKRQIPWQAAPESIGYSYPYILALQSPTKGSLEVRNPDTLNLLQTISLPGAASLHFPPPTVSLAHAGKGFHVLSERVVWKMDATDYDSQIDELVKTQRYDEAISILAMLEDALLKNKTETMREVKMLKAELLFRQRKFRESMDLFNEDEVHAPPERVLRLFPKIIVGELGVDEKKPEEPQEESDHEAPPNGKANGDHAPKEDEPHSEVSSPQKGGGFAKYLMGHGRKKFDPETSSIVSSRRAPVDDDAASIKGKTAEEQRAQDEKDLMTAVSELNSYLAGARARLQRVIDPVTGKLKPRKSANGVTEEAFNTLLMFHKDEDDEQLEKDLQETFRVVDTTLFRAFMYSRPTLASSLFRIPNFCDPQVVNERLVEHNRFNELVDFFYGKKLHRQALDLLRKFGSPDEPDEAAPTLHGPQRTVLYLQGLPPEMIDVILEFSEWTLRKDPKLGMEVFLADSENAETLPRARVLHFLGGIDTALEIQYLEHIISELNDMTPEFHNRLVELFIRQLREEKKQGKEEEWDSLMERLVQFLKDSRQYSLGRAFSLIPRDDPRFYEARAVVLSNMGQHKQALEIYVFQMKDYKKAEEYCNRIHKSSEHPQPTSPSHPPGTTTITSPSSTEDPSQDEAHPSIYHTLLSLYLTPPSPHKPNLPPALDLLSKHGSRLPATSTLSLIPDDLPVSELESYFRGRMRNANSIVNETLVVAGLRKTGLVTSQALLLLGDGLPKGAVLPGGGSRVGGRNRRVVIGEERVCGVCHKRLGGSVVAVLPGGEDAVVHYGCLGRSQQGKGMGIGELASPGQTGSVKSGVSGTQYGAWGRG